MTLAPVGIINPLRARIGVTVRHITVSPSFSFLESMAFSNLTGKDPLMSLSGLVGVAVADTS
jgi:hypothetical protein